MRNKKGFTLVELLAVIVILAVVSIVAIPIVINLIETAKKGALKDSLHGLLKSTDVYYFRYMKDKEEGRILKIEDDKQVDEYEKLNYKGKIKRAYIAIAYDGQTAICVDDGKYYASKNQNTDEIIVDYGICTSDFDDTYYGFVTTGGANYVGIRLNVKEYASSDDLPSTSHEGYIGVITNTKVTDYYFSDKGVENPKEGTVWLVQSSIASTTIKNDKSEIGVACVMQYENGKWEPKESYVFNDTKWVLLSKFDDLSQYTKTFDYTGKYQEYTAPYSGLYKVELWGAQGGSINATYYGGRGAYTSGDLYLDEGETIYVYVGGTTSAYTGGWNGGGNGINASSGSGRGGGGATDIRTVPTSAVGTWNEMASLRSRIMVAAGGPGASAYNTSDWLSYKGAGGGHEGILTTGGVSAVDYQTTPATASGGGMTNGRYPGQNGGFGYGGNSYTGYSSGGGGGGWYGGAGAAHAGSLNSGGSSYISGHQGCSSVDEEGISIGTAVSWTGKYFINTKMIDGVGYSWTTTRNEYTKMPNKSGSGEVEGNEGNGYAKISLTTPIYKSNETREKEIANLNMIWSYGASMNYQKFIAPANGTYKFELWGAQGANLSGYNGGLGAYTKGDIYLEKGTVLYMYVGGQGAGKYGGWNGGGTGTRAGQGIGSSGGGSVDVRTIATSALNVWNEVISLRSRIMVAGAGSGASKYNTSGWASWGGAAGGLEGLYGSGGADAYFYRVGSAPSQGAGGYTCTVYPGTNGGFGYGGNGYTGYSTNGGGSGWYGSAGGAHAGSVMTGGSSYISGHFGCNSVNENGIHTGSPYSYTNFIFQNTKMIDGEGYEWTSVRGTKQNMPGKFSTGTTEGNQGQGYARVTLLKKETKKDYAKTIINNQTQWAYSTTNSYQLFVAPKTGKYRVQLWGAQGGSYDNSFIGGKGGYTSGEIELEKGTKLFLFVGSYGRSTVGGYNGGGNGAIANSGRGYAGGGSTDIRVIGDNVAWSNAVSLKSRIMVAGGGAGSSGYNTGSWIAWSGAGGGLEGVWGTGGTDAKKYIAKTKSTQIAGGITNATYPGTNGGFGYGGNSYTGYSSNGGGSGWFGGAGGAHAGSVLTGGSSYISGHNGCIGVDVDGKLNASTATKVEDSYSYTGYKFTNTKIVDGEGYNWTTEKGSLTQMPTHDNKSLMEGNTGDGYALITFIK